MPAIFSINRLAAAAAAIFACAAFGAFGVASADAASAGILPPNNPAADCNTAGAQVRFTIQNLDVCRAKEGVGPLVLPSNWAVLTGAEQLFVLVDLERVNRGIAPVVGLSSDLNQLASEGAESGDDPAFPQGGFSGGGGIWFGGNSAIAADYAWMYDDGPNGLNVNIDCTSAGSSSCWLHRDIILWKGTGGALVAGGGSVSSSYAFELLSGYRSSGLAFTWAHELHYFAVKPAVESVNALARPARIAKPPKKHRRHAAASGSGSAGSSSGANGITITVG